MLILDSELCAQEKYSVYFKHDRFDLESSEENELLSWLGSFSDTALKVEVIGYADHLGTEEYNKTLSEKRVETVMSVLERQNSISFRMSLTDAKGESDSQQFNDARRNPKDRRVDILVSFKKKAESRSAPKSIEVPHPINEERKSDSDLLVMAEVGQTVVLRNLNFFPGRHFLIPQALPELERLAQILKDNPSMEIEIQGHICCKLDSLDGMDVDTKTYSLSFNRSKYIFEQLVLTGVAPERMSYRGFAGSRPLIKPEMTETDRQRNRRVEIRILKK